MLVCLVFSVMSTIDSYSQFNDILYYMVSQPYFVLHGESMIINHGESTIANHGESIILLGAEKRDSYTETFCNEGSRDNCVFFI